MVQEHFPAMNDVDIAGIYASGYIHEKDVEVLKSIDFDSFLNKTALPFGLLGCRIRFNSFIYDGPYNMGYDN